MDANVKEIIKIKMEACKKALEKNGMKAYLVEDAQAARELVNAMIKDHETVCDGGTMTLQDVYKRQLSNICIKQKLNRDNM